MVTCFIRLFTPLLSAKSKYKHNSQRVTVVVLTQDGGIPSEVPLSATPPPTQAHSRVKSIGNKQVVEASCCVLPSGPRIGGNQMGAHLESAEAARGLTLSHHRSVSTTFWKDVASLWNIQFWSVGRTLFFSVTWNDTLPPVQSWLVWKNPAQYELCLSDCCHFLSIDQHRRLFVIGLFSPSLDGTRPSITDSFSLTENEESNIFSFGRSRPCYLKDSPSVLASGLWGWGLVISNPGGLDRLKEENL